MRSVNWLQQTSRSLAASFPSLGQRSSIYISHRLSRLVLERLPSEIGHQLLELLPQNAESGDVADREELRDLYAAAEREPDLSIGYPSFVEQASRSVHEIPRTRPGQSHEDYLESVVDYFLWIFAQELPPELKERIVGALPLDIRNRMNLHSSHADEAKVA